MSTEMDLSTLQNLRSLVHDCLAKHLYDAAIFFADKLATFTDYAPIEVYNLANAFFVAHQFRRCLHLLRTSDFIDKDIRFRYLSARCLAEIKEWEECLELLGGLHIDTPEAFLAFPCPPSSPGSSLDYLSAMCLLRGQVYDALENFPRAVQWYKAALLRDPFNYSAFHALIERHKLTVEEESSLVDDLTALFPVEQRWLALLYRSKCKQYDAAGVEVGLEAVAALGADLSSSFSSFTAFPAATTVHGDGDGGGGGNGEDTETPAQQQRSMQSTPSTEGGGGGDVSMLGGTGGGGGGGGGGTPTPLSHSSGSVAAPMTRSAARRATTTNNTSMHQQQQQQQHPSSMAISPISEGSEGGMNTANTPETAPATTPMPTPSTSTTNQKRRILSVTPQFALGSNADVVAAYAELLLRRGRFREAYSITSTVLERDPYATAVLPAHLAAAVALGKKQELFSLGHTLMKAQPEQGTSWYAAGCYYYATNQFASARHYFAKATALDKKFAAAWIGFAQAFAAQDETDQAMAAFRTAARLFPGLHVPLLGMGLEYIRMNNLLLAEQTLLRAHRRCPADSTVAHELGTLLFRQGRYPEAVQWLNRALSSIPREYSALWEPTVVNLAHVYRKLRRFDKAIEMLTRALGASAGQAGTYGALGYTYHLIGNLPAAIENYHKALGLRPYDDFYSAMLAVAVGEEWEERTAALTEGMDPMGIGE